LVDKDSKNEAVQRSVPRRCVCANQPIYFVTPNVTRVNLAVTNKFNYELIMLKEIVIVTFISWTCSYNTLIKCSKIIKQLCLVLFWTLGFKFKLTKQIIIIMY
jgi:hypothetical protein